jgi:hypothetical protein
MLSLVKMLGGMLVFGTIATTDMAAGEAKPQMNPGVAHFQAFLAAVSSRLRFVGRRKVFAWTIHSGPRLAKN